MRLLLASCFLSLVSLTAGATDGSWQASAIPYFAHEYAMTCQKCHSVIPRLSEFGRAFEEHGYALPGTQPVGAIPLSMKVNLAYTSAPDPGLPKAIVDEVEVFLAGRANARTNYFVEQYLVDGGRPGTLREAWIGTRIGPADADAAAALKIGAFGLPLPVDPETFRETAAHYAVFDQTVGFNPFSFFESKIGIDVTLRPHGNRDSLDLVAVQGHDRQSGLPSDGIDTMASAAARLGETATLSLFRYDGTRPVGVDRDRFWRQGIGLSTAGKRLSLDAVALGGRDADVNGSGEALWSRGAFVQARYAMTRKIFSLVRYDTTTLGGSGSVRDIVALAGFRPARNARITIEDLFAPAAASRHTINAQYTVAY